MEKNNNSQREYKHNNPVVWWDSEYDKVVRLRKAAFKKWDFTKILEDYINYKKQAAVTHKTLKTKKKKVSRHSPSELLSILINHMHGTQSKFLKINGLMLIRYLEILITMKN